MRDVGAWFLFPPPYSPALKPIAMAVAKLKALVRRAAARTTPHDDRPGASGLASSGLATHTQDEGDDPFRLSGHCCAILCRAVDQGAQFTSRKWQLFLSQHNLQASISRRGNCHDHAVAESFFQLLKRERIRYRTYPTREAARQDVFDYTEMF